METQEPDSTPLKRATIGVLGGGQLGRMFIEAANREDITVNVLDEGHSPAKQVSNHDGHVSGKFSDPDAIKTLAGRSDILTIEIEHVNAEALEEVSKALGDDKVHPHPSTIRLIQNKFDQKEHLSFKNIPVAEYRQVNYGSNEKENVQELQTTGGILGYPFMLKSQTNAYDGRGNFPIKSESDIPAVVRDLSANRTPKLYAEKWVAFRKELAVMVVQTGKESLPFPTVETVHEDSICKLVYAPARGVSEKLSAKAQDLACRAVSTFKGKGVYGVEMFLVGDESNPLLVNEIAPRPHNSGHYTIEACPLSQYDAHLRSILDWEIPTRSLRLREPSIMLNILGGAEPDSHLRVQNLAAKISNARTHLYGKDQAKPGRKMGHVTITAPSMYEAELTIEPLIVLVDTIRAERLQKSEEVSKSAFKRKKDRSMAPVAVIMGSKTDLPTLKPGLALLRELDIPVTVRITSAHRTPTLMASFSSYAAANGVKCIIAAAGGAAHLPGMAAAHTALPVIGVPIKPSIGDGTDSLLSIVSMPRGVPVATVGINNSVNAALLAARVLGVADTAARDKILRYADQAADMAKQTDEDLQKKGWDAVVAEIEGK